MTTASVRHSRLALVFLIGAIVAALIAMPLLRAVGIVQWPVFAIAWLINLGAAWHLGQWRGSRAVRSSPSCCWRHPAPWRRS